MKTVFANGCFDGPGGCHVGHIYLLRRAAALGDRLIVAINSDDSCRRLKGGTRPMATASIRAARLRMLPWVTKVLEFGTETELHDLLVAIRPDIFVKGAGSGPTPGQEFAGRVIYFPLVEGISTTILERAINGI